MPFADVGPLKIDERLLGRTGAVPLRHPADRLHGRGDVRHQARRHHRRLGLRPGRAVRDQERVPARGRARDRHRPVRLPAGDGPREVRRRDGELRDGRQRQRDADRDDRADAVRTPASTPSVSKRTATGSAYLYDRTKQALELEIGPADRVARSDHGLPQWRDRLGHRRLRRPGRQVSARHRS